MSKAIARWKCFVKASEGGEWIEIDPRTGQTRTPEDGRVRVRGEFEGPKVTFPLGIEFGDLDTRLFFKTAKDIVAYESARGIAVKEVEVRNIYAHICVVLLIYCLFILFVFIFGFRRRGQYSFGGQCAIPERPIVGTIWRTP